MAIYNTRIQSKHDTTENWNNAQGFIPMAGEIIIYDDYQTIEYENQFGETVTRNVPGIKIGSGNAYVQDLAFVDGSVRDKLMEHIENEEMHLLLGERQFWNSKVDIVEDEEFLSTTTTDDEEDEGKTLVFTRNDWRNYKGEA